MDNLISNELSDKLSELKEQRFSSNDGKNILLPFIEVFQAFLDTLQLKFDKFKQEMTTAHLEKDKLIKNLHAEISSKKKTISQLEHKLDDQDQYVRRETLIFSGDSIPIVAGNDENCTLIICNLVNQKLSSEGLNIEPKDLSIAHRLGPKPTSRQDRRSIIAKFCRRSIKYQILKAARTKKVENFFVSESLTPPRQTITRVLRKTKRDYPDIVSGYSTNDGSISVWVKPPNPQAAGARNSRVTLNTLEKLEQFCQRNFSRPYSDFILANVSHHEQTD